MGIESWWSCYVKLKCRDNKHEGTKISILGIFPICRHFALIFTQPASSRNVFYAQYRRYEPSTSIAVTVYKRSVSGTDRHLSYQLCLTVSVNKTRPA